MDAGHMMFTFRPSSEEESARECDAALALDPRDYQFPAAKQCQQRYLVGQNLK